MSTEPHPAPTLRLIRRNSALPGDYVSGVLLFSSGRTRPLRVLPEDLAELEAVLAHQFDESSVINPATGGPYPLWAGTEPQEPPDPLCVCGAPWLDDECSRESVRLRATVARLEAELATYRSAVEVFHGGIAQVAAERDAMRPVVEAAKAFREAAASPKHSQFWRQPWSEMADLCRAVDQLTEVSDVD